MREGRKKRKIQRAKEEKKEEEGRSKSSRKRLSYEPKVA